MTQDTSATHVVVATGLDDLERRHPIEAGRVVPHLTFDGDGFRIRHLAFDAGAVLPEHVAPDPVVISVVEGHVRFEVEGDTHDLRTGAIIHLDRDIPHVVTAVEPSRLMLTLIG